MLIPTVVGYHVPRVDDVRALLARVPKGVQLLRADRVYGADHLRHAARLAERAVAEGRARTSDVQTETALYAAGERQIGRALAFIGLAEGVDSVAAVSWGPSAWEPPAGWQRDDAVLAGGPHVLDAFQVPPEERALFPPERWG